MENKSYIKNEILRLTTAPSGDCWARSYLSEMANEAMELLKDGKARDIDNAIFKVIDASF